MVPRDGLVLTLIRLLFLISVILHMVVYVHNVDLSLCDIVFGPSKDIIVWEI